MYKKNIIFLCGLIILLTSCKTMDSVKKGLTGEKVKSTDEFLVKKKDPLILPPNFEDLPLPQGSQEDREEISLFENKSSTETSGQSNSSTEQSILEKIKRN